MRRLSTLLLAFRPGLFGCGAHSADDEADNTNGSQSSNGGSNAGEAAAGDEHGLAPEPAVDATEGDDAEANGQPSALEPSPAPATPTRLPAAAPAGGPTARVDRDAGSNVEPASTGRDVYASADSTCWFEFLGNGVRCVATEADFDQEREALSTCAVDCLSNDDCTSISDYTYFGLGLGCYVHTGGCEPGHDIWYEEDGAREYRKVCGEDPPEGAIVEFSDARGFAASETSECRFVPVADFMRCEGTVPADEASLTFDTLEECTAACAENSECGAVQDWWYAGPTEFECALHLGTCDQPTERDRADYANDSSEYRFYAKVCP